MLLHLIYPLQFYERLNAEPTRKKQNKTKQYGRPPWKRSSKRASTCMLRKPGVFLFCFRSKTSISLFQFAHLPHAPSPPDAINSDTSKRLTKPNHDTRQQKQKLPPFPALHLQDTARSLARPSRGTGYETDLAQRHRRIASIRPIVPIENGGRVTWRGETQGTRQGGGGVVRTSACRSYPPLIIGSCNRLPFRDGTVCRIFTSQRSCAPP